MVGWRDPSVVTGEYIALIKCIHLMGGIYIWEFVTSLNFEYSVITRKRRFSWSFLLYMGCRWFPLFALASQFLGSDASRELNCQAWVIFTFMFGYLSFIFASALVILRLAILWNRNKIVHAIATAVWLGNAAVYAYSMVTLYSTWSGTSCIVLHTDHGKISVLYTFCTDSVLLILMLIGIMRWKNAPESSGVWRLLRAQGLLWLVIVTLAEVPAVVFILLNLNDVMNLICQVVALVIMALGAARIYRGLVDYPAFNSSVRVIGDSEWTHGLGGNEVATSASQPTPR